MTHRLQDDSNAILQRMDHRHDHQPAEALPEEDGESRESEAEPAITETIHVYVVHESELADPADEQVVESTLATGDDDPLHRAAFADEPAADRPLDRPETVEHAPPLDPRTRASLARWTAGVVVVLLLTGIAFQMLLLFLTPTPTITLVPVVRDLSTTATPMAVAGTPAGANIPARLLPPLTLTQTKTVPATGKGHQDAEAAMGTITFYNGLFTSQTIAAGTTLNGSDGIQIVTDQLAVIPAALATPPCTRTVTADHQAGAEAARVTVTVSEQCTAIAYDAVVLQELAQRVGTHYRLVGAVQVSVLHARIIDQRREVASTTVHIEGTWIYQFSQQELQWIKQLIAGKTPSQAVHILLGLPGIQRAAIAGIGESRSLPKDSSCIQVHILYGEALSVITQSIIGF